MKQLYYIRHGLSIMNKQGIWSGQRETPLAPEGIAGAQQAGEAARKLGIDYIISSPYSRAYDTAKIVAAAINYPIEKIEQNSLLIERHFGSLEGTPWHPDIDMDGIADAESVDSLMNRALLAFEHLQTIPEANIILVAGHGSFGRALKSVITGTPFNEQIKIKNAEIVRLI